MWCDVLRVLQCVVVLLCSRMNLTRVIVRGISAVNDNSTCVNDDKQKPTMSRDDPTTRRGQIRLGPRRSIFKINCLPLGANFNNSAAALTSRK